MTKFWSVLLVFNDELRVLTLFDHSLVCAYNS
jgi:hypothetical protein